MVKEVEIASVYEQLAVAQDYSIVPYAKVLDGYLSDEGMTFHLKVDAPLPNSGVGARKIFLHFVNVDFDNNLTQNVKLGETELDSCPNILEGRPTTEYTFDLSEVVKIPRKIYNTTGTSEIVVELYTYEANLSTDYGSKRLSVPYTITSDTKYKYDKSTDGIYQITLVDFPSWSQHINYQEGDIVFESERLLISLQNNNNMPPNDNDWWGVPTEEELLKYATGTTVHLPLRVMIADMMITRYAKYGIIKDVLMETSFKPYNDDVAIEKVGLLQSIRDRAKINLYKHKPINALYDLQLLKQASSNFTDKTEIHNYDIKYTS